MHTHVAVGLDTTQHDEQKGDYADIKREGAQLTCPTLPGLQQDISHPFWFYVHPFWFVCPSLCKKLISMSIPLQEADFYAHPFARNRLLFSPLCKKLRSLVGLKDLETLEKAWDPSHSRSEH
jgi:hypothetical protein